MSMEELTHLDASGAARMVDVGAKPTTRRMAVARGHILLHASTLALVEGQRTRKGDVIATARIAGIMAAKRTSELIPLCHALAITSVSIDFTMRKAWPVASQNAIEAVATVHCFGQTGVEMEALTAVSVACLTLYDMLKAHDKTMEIAGIHLAAKTGGKSGDFYADAEGKALAQAHMNAEGEIL